MKKLINIGMVTFLVTLTILFLSGENVAMEQKGKEVFSAKASQIDNIPSSSNVANELVYEKTKDTWVVVISIVNLLVILILVVITAWYAHSTSRMHKEMQRQADLMIMSIAASVEAGICSMPGPGRVSTAQRDAYTQLVFLRGKINELIKSSTCRGQNRESNH